VEVLNTQDQNTSGNWW